MQDIIQMCSFDASKSTKGASKLRRDLINTEIGHLRDLLPLPASTRQRLSQLQLMALVCVYVRKANYFQQVFKRHDLGQMPTPSIGFSKAMNGFLMMMTQNGKLLYISDNAAEYLGHSMEDLLIHGDSVYDIIDKQDHQSVQNEMGRPPVVGSSSVDDARIFLCRMNVSRNARRQMRFGDQKVILVEGHFVSYLPLCTRNEPVLIATCTPVAMPETRECVVQGATNIFTSVHNMDMTYVSLDPSGEFYLGYSRQELMNVSWYQLLHWDFMREAQSKHRLITQSEQDRSCILLVRLQRRNSSWLWIHCVLQVKEAAETGQQPVIICTNQILSEREAEVMRANSWLYHYYLVQSKLQYGMAGSSSYEGQQSGSSAQQGAGNSRSSSSPGYGGYQAPLMDSPVPSASSCSGEAASGGSQPPFFSGLLVPSPSMTSPHYVQQQHLYNPNSSGGQLDGYQQHPSSFPSSNSGSGSNNNPTGQTGGSNYSFTPSPGSSGHHHYPAAGPSSSASNYQQHTSYHIKTEANRGGSYPSGSSATERTGVELGAPGYHIKLEAKSDVESSGSNHSVIQQLDHHHTHHHHHSEYDMKEEPSIQQLSGAEDPSAPTSMTSPVSSSPPRKRYRVMASSTSLLPSAGVPPFNYHPHPSGGVGHGDHHQHPHHHHQQHQSGGHHHHHQQYGGQGVWGPNNTGWINTSYPVGLAQLDETGYSNNDDGGPSLGGGDSVSFSATSFQVQNHYQRKLNFRHKNVSDSSPTTYYSPLHHGTAELIQRVPDCSVFTSTTNSSTTLPPELSPLGYVLTPAPTPPDSDDSPAAIVPNLVTGRLEEPSSPEEEVLLNVQRHIYRDPTTIPSPQEQDGLVQPEPANSPPNHINYP